jgi:phospholipid/cholesterol/gamma-HCH transport system permease protein
MSAIRAARDIVPGGVEKVSAVRSSSGDLAVRLAGTWNLRDGIPTARSIENELAKPPPPRRLVIDAKAVSAWDSSLLSFLVTLADTCKARNIPISHDGLPAGLNRLLALADAVPETADAHTDGQPLTFAGRVGAYAIAWGDAINDAIAFVGEVGIALGRWARGSAHFRSSDLLEVVQACSVNALGIVTLISYLVGIILAFMGAVQLQQFGASIYVADLVGIGITREMGAMMTGVIMSGRTGAAFAAQLGTMKVTQEIDALSTMGIAPMEFLVLPRVIALILMMPLLCLYADMMGILGGATVGTGMLGISFRSYMLETVHAILPATFVGGLVKSMVYGVLIALSGCYEGFNCGNSSSAVGDAATRAVVDSIVAIVIACGLFAVAFNILDI